MSRTRTIAIFLAVVFAALPSAAWAQATPNKMKLLTQNTGWLLRYGQLYWTTDFGHDWRKITPPGVASRGPATIADVFFLDTSYGWALLRTPDKTGKYGDWRFELASTHDSGMNWSATPVTLPNWDAKQHWLGGGGTVFFLDPSHGWIDLSVESSAAFNSGAQFATADGGGTWQPVPAPVGFGWIRFITAETGWAAGGPGGSQLAVTRDGGKTWRRVRLSPPSGLPKNSMPTYGPPRFANPRRGFLAVNFNGWAAVVYSTTDVGRTWRPVLVLVGTPGSLGDGPPPLAIVDSTAVMPTTRRGGRMGVRKFSLVASAPYTGHLPSLAGPSGRPSFADPDRGWTLAAGLAYATSDGGNTWTVVTPKPPPAPSRLGVVPPPRPWFPGRAADDGAPTANTTLAAPANGGGSEHTSVHLGFDAGLVLPHTDMQTWWKYSPYYDVGVYIGGENATYPVLTEVPPRDSGTNAPTWVSDVTSYGWGTWPIYVGPQAPCACKDGKGQYPSCTDGTYGTTIDEGVSSANSQGASEATNAESKMQKLGLGQSIIYADLEQYDSSYTWAGSATTCGQYVQAYISGWDSKLIADGYTPAVYGSPTDASDWWNASPQPKDAWIGKEDKRATIWGLGYEMADTGVWSEGYRAHQYMDGVSETYGDTQQYLIDRDIEYAQVDGGARTKSYTYPSSGFSDITGGIPAGIDDADLGQGSSALPDMAGSYTTGTGCSATTAGFYVDSQGTRTDFSAPGAEYTYASGLNDIHEMVGSLYPGGTGCTSWYLYYQAFFGTVSGGTFSGNAFTTPTGLAAPYDKNGTYLDEVNDDGMAIGYYEDPNEIYHAFTYNTNTAGPEVPFAKPRALSTGLGGINGFGQMSGVYTEKSGSSQPFLWDNNNFTNFNEPCGKGVAFGIGQINNDGLVVGDCLGGESFVYNTATGQTVTVTDPNAAPPGTFTTCSTCAAGINDAGEIVGFYMDASGVQHGFIAKPTPQ